MAARTVTVTDGAGTVVEEYDVDVPDDLTPDIVAIANDLAAQRTRLDAAEDALFFLITDSLGGI